MNKRAPMISFEGIEGVGKSTNIAFCEHWLQTHDLDVVRTREPGGTPMGERIRAVLLDDYQEKVHAKAEALLFYAARVQHVHELIIPHLEAGKWVLCDRFMDASIAYQGGGRDVGIEKVLALNEWALGEFEPDHTILLDAPVEVALERMRSRGGLDRIEKEDESFFQRIRDGYLSLKERYPHRYHVVDASGSLEDVQDQLETILHKVRDAQL